jgi:hypothetical protein
MDNKVLDKLQKMLALGKCMGTTEHERDTAMKMAYKLMVAHNITEADISKHRAPEVRDRYEAAGWAMPWCRDAIGIVADLFFCTHAWNMKKINSTKMMHYFYGKESNAKTAMYMADFIVSAILKEGRSRFGDNLCAETRSFATGCVVTLRRRVRQLKADAIAEQQAGTYTGGTELMLIDLYAQEEASNQALMTGVKPAKERKVAPVDSYAYHAGREFAKDLSLNVGIGSKTAK